MIKIHFEHLSKVMEYHRFNLLLIATLLVLILPAFSDKGFFTEILFVSSLTFLFIQSAFVASSGKSRKRRIRISITVFMIILFWLEPLGLKSRFLEIIKLAFLPVFFILVSSYLARFIRNARFVNKNVIITAITIYLLTGIIFGSLAYLVNDLYTQAYNFPEYIVNPDYNTFTYYSFVTMSTVGYGEITPRISESQVLAYFTAITGQLYVAVIIGFLIGKLLSHQSETDNK